MKPNMRGIDRVLLGLYALLGFVVIAVLAFAFCSGLKFSLFGYSIQLGEGALPFIILVAAAVLLLAWSIKLMTLACCRRPRPGKDSVSLQSTENGAVRISMQAMETLARQAIGRMEGVEKIRTAILNHEDSISVNIDMTVRSDVHIPNVTMLMQHSVKSFIEEYSGIAVRDVVVLVSHIEEAPMELSVREKTEDSSARSELEPESQPEPGPEIEPEPELESESAPEREPLIESEPEIEPLPEAESAGYIEEIPDEEIPDEEILDEEISDVDRDEEFNEKNIW